MMKNRKIDLKAFGTSQSAILLAEELNKINSYKISRNVVNFIIDINTGINQITPIIKKALEKRKENKNYRQFEVGFMILKYFRKGVLKRLEEEFNNIEFLRSVVISRFKIAYRELLQIDSKWKKFE